MDMNRILVVGNCQTLQVAAIMSSIPGIRVDRKSGVDIKGNCPTLDELLTYDVVISQDFHLKAFPEFKIVFEQHPKGIILPVLVFQGFHPDNVDTNLKSGGVAVSDSLIVSAGFKIGLSPEDVSKLFCNDFFERLGYFSIYDSARRNFTRQISGYVKDASVLFERWTQEGVFMHTRNHPKLWVVENILREVLGQYDIALPEQQLSSHIIDPLLAYGSFPTLNHPRSPNKLGSDNQLFYFGPKAMALGDFIQARYNSYNTASDDIIVSAANVEKFSTALEMYRHSAPKINAARNPYAGRPKRHLWAQAAAEPATLAVAPTAKLNPLLLKETKVATAGSCFAQHIAKTMSKNGLSYLVTERGPEHLSSDERERLTYGMFTARYGNIYSSRQLLQLIRRAYGTFEPHQSVWQSKRSEGYVDPFRPNLGDTFATPDDVLADRELHFAAVRKMFEELDVFVFTMGLTEIWADARDGAVFPVAPGVVAKGLDATLCRFENLDTRSVHQDMAEFLCELKKINPLAKVILTVSPVPLIATYTDNDALTATTYSKAVLRAVAGELEEAYSFVHYFPSFEIITGNFTRGAYFERDLRSVKADGVSHVMRVFMDTLVLDGADPAPVAEPDESISALSEEYQRELKVICDEELIAADMSEAVRTQ